MRGVWLVLLLAACGPAIGEPDLDGGTSGGGTTGVGTTGVGPTTQATVTSSTSTGVGDVTASPTTTGAGSSPSTSLETGGFVDSGSFIVGESGGGCLGADPRPGTLRLSVECDVFVQDCCPGEKCVPWANDGGNMWNATRCAPIIERAELGELCMVEGSAVSGIDNCAAGLMCWNVDSNTLTGQCVAFCSGSDAAPVCDDPADACAILYDGAAPLCLPRCAPLAPDCAAGESCLLAGGDAFTCVDVFGAGAAFGEPCAYLTECDPGLVCMPAPSVPGCTDENCCTSLCDTNAVEPDASCPGFVDGQVCVPFFADGGAPPGLEGLGVCASD